MAGLNFEISANSTYVKNETVQELLRASSPLLDSMHFGSAGEETKG